MRSRRVYRKVTMAEIEGSQQVEITAGTDETTAVAIVSWMLMEDGVECRTT